MAESFKKMICVGVGSRSLTEGIGSYNLVEYGDQERNIKNYSVEYIINAIKRRDMVVANLKLNETLDGLVYTDLAHQKAHIQPLDDEDEEDTIEDENGSKKPRKAVRRRKHKSSGKRSRKR